eukprot:s1160_g9.t1
MFEDICFSTTLVFCRSFQKGKRRNVSSRAAAFPLVAPTQRAQRAPSGWYQGQGMQAADAASGLGGLAAAAADRGQHAFGLGTSPRNHWTNVQQLRGVASLQSQLQPGGGERPRQQHRQLVPGVGGG